MGAEKPVGEEHKAKLMTGWEGGAKVKRTINVRSLHFFYKVCILLWEIYMKIKPTGEGSLLKRQRQNLTLTNEMNDNSKRQIYLDGR